MIVEFTKNFFRKKPGVSVSSDCVQQMLFKGNETPLSIGVESELHMVNRQSFEPANRADEVAAKLNMEKHVQPEGKLSTLEIITGIHTDAHSAAAEMGAIFDKVIEASHALEVEVMPSSCHPSAHHKAARVREDERYQLLMDRFQWLYRQWTATGMHIHIGMTDEKECMRYMNFFRSFVPHFTALSASSPFFQGEDTGLLSSRAILNEALPIAPLMHSVSTWDELRQLVISLEKSGTIRNYKDLWWDVRPAPRFGTLELRMFDMPTNLTEQKAIVAFVHALAIWFSENAMWAKQISTPKHWIARENKWRAIRYGMEATLINDTDGETVTLRDDLEAWLERLQPVITRLRYQNEIADLRKIIQDGPAALRLQRVYEQTGNMDEVMAHAIREFQMKKPIPVAATGKMAEPEVITKPILEELGLLMRKRA